MRKCTACDGSMVEHQGKTPENIGYTYWKCKKCGEEIVDMEQLHQMAEKYRILKRYHVKLSKWGLSLGLRIPKELVRRYKLKGDEEVALVPEKEGLRIIPS